MAITTMRFFVRQALRQLKCTGSRASSTSAPAPPLLLKVKRDLKEAMKAKDTNRLNVLRGLLAEATNASKTSSPIHTDMQVLALLRKRSASSKAATEEFRANDRKDLAEKEEAQIAVLDEYAAQVQTASAEEIQQAVQSAIQKLQAEGKHLNVGSLMKAVAGPGTSLDGKADKSEVARIVKDSIPS